MIFISAGHNPNGVKKDSGAVGNGLHEANLAVEIRDLVITALKAKGIKYVCDQDTETLSQYLSRIQTGIGSVVLEFHFDAAASPTATGCTALIEGEADAFDRSFAKKLVDTTATTLGIKNRGVISEAESHRGRLGLMREDGIICLLEVCFITNKDDIAKYNANKSKLAVQIADILIEFDALI